MRAVHISAAIDFVDRQREMGELVSALDDAMSGQGRVVMLAGYPGIGKTRTAQEFAAIAETRNAEVFWGHCYEGEGAPPYWPWLQIIRSHIDQSDVESLKASMGSGAEAIDEIVPELISKLTDLGSPPRFASSSARFRLFDSITTYLKNASVDKPMALILEDLHCADASSLALLEHAAADVSASNLMIIGTYGDIEVSTEHPLSRTQGSLVRHEDFRWPEPRRQKNGGFHGHHQHRGRRPGRRRPHRRWRTCHQRHVEKPKWFSHGRVRQYIHRRPAK